MIKQIISPQASGLLLRAGIGIAAFGIMAAGYRSEARAVESRAKAREISESEKICEACEARKLSFSSTS
jgi:hypothetical protein